MINFNRFPQFTYILTVVLVIILCSTPTFATSNSSPNSNSHSSLYSTELIDVVLQLRWDHQFQFAGYYAADWLGFYEEEGLSVEIRSAVLNGEILDGPTEIKEGRADFGVGAANILIAQDSGIDLTLVASIFQRSAVEYCTLLDQQANTVFDISQLNIARRPGDLLDLELQALFASEGIPPHALRTSDITRDFTLEDLKSGTFDVVPEYLGQVSYTAFKENLPLKVIKPAEYGVDFYGDTLFTSRKLAKENPEIVERFRNATIKGWYYALENPEVITNLIVERLSRSDIRPNTNYNLKDFNSYQAKKVLEITHYPIVEVGNINTFRWERMAKVMEELEMISEAPDLKNMIFDYDQIKVDQLKDTKLDLSIFFSIVTTCLIFFFLISLNRRNMLLEQEIIDRELAEKRLILSNSRYATIFQSSVLGITVTDSQGNIQTVNDAWCRMTGYSSDELCQMNINTLIAPKYRETDEKQLSDLNEGRISSFSMVKKYIRRPSDSEEEDYFYGRMVLTRIWSEQSEPILNMSMVTDITREIQETEANQRSEVRFRKIVGQVAQEIGGTNSENLHFNKELSMDLEEINMELEKLFTHELEENRKKDALIRYQAKMAAMGEMIGSIAHQWRQPLNTLKLVLLNLKDSGDDQDYVETCYKKANMLIRRMSETIDDFRYFSNPKKEPSYFSIEESIKLVLGLVDEQLRVSGITLEVNCKSLPPLCGFDNQFSHILFNLVSNSIDALKQNPLGSPRLISINGEKTGSDLLIRVEDSGPGIPKENIEKIFDMYFTTKEADGGSGLGLAMAYSILEDTFNGKLTLLDTTTGCAFEIRIPY